MRYFIEGTLVKRFAAQGINQRESIPIGSTPVAVQDESPQKALKRYLLVKTYVNHRVYLKSSIDGRHTLTCKLGTYVLIEDTEFKE